jgi:transposase-like protein
VITAVQRRRHWSVAEKIRLVEEALEPGMSVSFVVRKHSISPSLLFKWRQRTAEGWPGSGPAGLTGVTPQPSSTLAPKGQLVDRRQVLIQIM